MKKKVLKSFMAMAFVTVGFISYNATAGPVEQPKLANDENTVWGTGRQYWHNRWDLCCDKSSEYPCRQSTTNC